MINRYVLRTPITGQDAFLQSSNWKCNYIIRIKKNGKYVIYDYRMYANMKTIDFNYFGYSRVSDELSLNYAKHRVNILTKKDQE